MSAQLIIKHNIGKVLQRKADNAKDERLISALIKADLTGLSKDQIIQKLKNIVDEIIEE